MASTGHTFIQAEQLIHIADFTIIPCFSTIIASGVSARGAVRDNLDLLAKAHQAGREVIKRL